MDATHPTIPGEPDNLREYTCPDHTTIILEANAFAILAGEEKRPVCPSCGKEMHRPTNLGRSPLIAPKYELGFPIADVSTYFPEGPERERARENVKRNNTRPVVSLGKKIEEAMGKDPKH